MLRNPTLKRVDLVNVDGPLGDILTILQRLIGNNRVKCVHLQLSQQSCDNPLGKGIQALENPLGLGMLRRHNAHP